MGQPIVFVSMNYRSEILSCPFLILVWYRADVPFWRCVVSGFGFLASKEVVSTEELRWIGGTDAMFAQKAAGVGNLGLQDRERISLITVHHRRDLHTPVNGRTCRASMGSKVHHGVRGRPSQGHNVRITNSPVAVSRLDR